MKLLKFIMGLFIVVPLSILIGLADLFDSVAEAVSKLWNKVFADDGVS
jgi:hypothetical protein